MLALVLSLFGAAFAVSVQQARAATLAEQILCYVDQQMGSSSPFSFDTDYCSSGEPTDPGEMPQCFDGVDNDSDGKTDSVDPGCSGPTDDSESPDPAPTLMQCQDTVDNDNDGVVDMADPDCDSATDNTESGTMGTSTGTTTPLMQCEDTLDNDSDGVIDLSDPDCGNAQDNTESGTMGTSTGTTTPLMQCEDTLDNDTDGVIDLADPDCASASDDTESGSSGTSTGTTTDAALHVDSIDAQKTTAIANDNYADGWRYLFHITTPTNEENFSMRFSDWFVSSSSSTTIPVANNMRISSAQAASTSPITLTGSNIYSTPALIMASDTNASMPGRQVDVLVEVKIPTSTPNVTFTTMYGVQTLP